MVAIPWKEKGILFPKKMRSSAFLTSCCCLVEVIFLEDFTEEAIRMRICPLLEE